jgi:hypothetical protein
MKTDLAARERPYTPDLKNSRFCADNLDRPRVRCGASPGYSRVAHRRAVVALRKRPTCGIMTRNVDGRDVEQTQGAASSAILVPDASPNERSSHREMCQPRQLSAERH